jgi:phosphatidylglycerol:prolipoprotein diacylglycerol transferase
VLDAIFYHPDAVIRDPLYLLKLWDGLSSYGGFSGAILGALAWKYTRRERALPYVDMVASAFPLAWVFGRAGCSVAHDHPGRISNAWIAVRYPSGSAFVGRFDLGLYEMLLTIPLAVAFAILWKRKVRPYGFFTGMMCTAYAPVRFFLDFLRAPDDGGVAGADPRYAGLTPAQWASFGLLAIGVYFLRLAKRPENQPAVIEAARAERERASEAPERDGEGEMDEPPVAPPAAERPAERS